MSTRISDLTPEMQVKVRTMLSLVNIPYVVARTKATTDEQVAYWCKGRASLEVVNLLMKKAGLPLITEGDNNIVTQCDGVNTLSNHQSGNAIDIVPAGPTGQPVWPHPDDPRWLVLGKFGEAAGLSWGGRWVEFPDRPHFQLK